MLSSRTTWEIDVEFAADDPIFQTHFPGHPVVPASLVIQAALSHGFAPPCFPAEISRFRFYHFLSPGHYRFLFSRRTDGVVCEVLQQQKRFARGTFRFPKQ